VGIAETGTLVLDGQGVSGRRLLTLVPDHHICVVRPDQIVGLVPEAIAAVAPSAERGLPITLVSGPSASSDIELERVEGVHGPRHLLVLIVGAGPAE
jgi:L-lactate dehydrogenase complex protein LldG